jgi:hypothetical protein
MKTNEDTSNVSDTFLNPPEEKSLKVNEKTSGILPTIGQVISPKGEVKDLEVDEEVLVPLVELPPPPGEQII